jgi:plastocyanin
MKAGSLIGVIIVIIAIVGGLWVLSSNRGSEYSENEFVDMEDEAAGGQFIQVAPEEDDIPLPPGAGDDAKETGDNMDVAEKEVLAGEMVTISMTDTGFEPANVTIVTGTTVTFTNNAQASKWPASNVHPTHQSYPGSDNAKCKTDEAASIFDACQGLSTGESYSFNFVEPGSWAYHDHLQASQGGTVTVK